MTTQMDSLKTFALLIALANRCLAQQGASFNVPPDLAPSMIGAGDSINLHAGALLANGFRGGKGSKVSVFGGSLGYYPEIEGELNIFGGNSGFYLTATGAQINLHEGMLGTHSVLRTGQLKMSGGTVGALFSAYDSHVIVSGGTVSAFDHFDKSSLTLTGGVVQYFFLDPVQSDLLVTGGILGGVNLGYESTFTMSGGALASSSRFVAYADSSVSLKVRSAVLNGTTIVRSTNAAPVALDVTNTLGSIGGLLADGSPFQFQLASRISQDAIGSFIITDRGLTKSGVQKPSVVIHVTLVPEPQCLLTWTVASGLLVARRLVAHGRLPPKCKSGQQLCPTSPPSAASATTSATLVR